MLIPVRLFYLSTYKCTSSIIWFRDFPNHLLFQIYDTKVQNARTSDRSTRLCHTRYMHVNAGVIDIILNTTIRKLHAGHNIFHSELYIYTLYIEFLCSSLYV